VPIEITRSAGPNGENSFSKYKIRFWKKKNGMLKGSSHRQAFLVVDYLLFFYTYLKTVADNNFHI